MIYDLSWVFRRYFCCVCTSSFCAVMIALGKQLMATNISSPKSRHISTRLHKDVQELQEHRFTAGRTITKYALHTVYLSVYVSCLCVLVWVLFCVGPFLGSTRLLLRPMKEGRSYQYFVQVMFSIRIQRSRWFFMHNLSVGRSLLRRIVRVQIHSSTQVSLSSANRAMHVSGIYQIYTCTIFRRINYISGCFRFSIRIFIMELSLYHSFHAPNGSLRFRSTLLYWAFNCSSWNRILMA